MPNESAAPVRGSPARAFEPNQVDIGSSPTLIVAARPERRAVLVVNHGTADVFLGGSGVTLTNGLLLAGVKGAGVVIPTDVAIYGITASSQRVSVAELYGK